MQRLLNDPDRVVDDMLDGFLRVHAESAQRCDENPRVIARTRAAPRQSGACYRRRQRA